MRSTKKPRIFGPWMPIPWISVNGYRSMHYELDKNIHIECGDLYGYLHGFFNRGSDKHAKKRGLTGDVWNDMNCALKKCTFPWET